MLTPFSIDLKAGYDGYERYSFETVSYASEEMRIQDGPRPGLPKKI